MYLYSFSQYIGQDRVFWCELPSKKVQAGGVLQSESDFFLVLGETVSFPELYQLRYPMQGEFHVAFPKLLSSPALELVHWMVYERYTTYKNTLKLFLDHEIQNLLAKAKRPTSKKYQPLDFSIGKQRIRSEEQEQILIIFPDLRMFTNLIDQQAVGGLFLSALDTQARKNLNRWKIKQGEEQLIFCTGAEVFQDFKKLGQIFLVEPQKRYYASQQDPRYKLETVAKKIAELHGIPLQLIESEMLAQ